MSLLWFTTVPSEYLSFTLTGIMSAISFVYNLNCRNDILVYTRNRVPRVRPNIWNLFKSGLYMFIPVYTLTSWVAMNSTASDPSFHLKLHHTWPVVILHCLIYIYTILRIRSPFFSGNQFLQPLKFCNMTSKLSIFLYMCIL